MLTTDGKLYRLTGGAWAKNTPTTDLTGTIASNQIAASAIDSSKLANNAITDVKLAAGAVTASKMSIRKHMIY
jgi:hypothetical protein